jgi:uncharacterized membrane protein
METKAHLGWAEPSSSAVTVAHVVYALHAISLAIGAWTAATVVGSFLFGWPSIVAVVLNYSTRISARGTWLESHFNWQISTFWYALLWASLLLLISAPLFLVLIGFATWAVGCFLLGIWASYRIIKGWWQLKDNQPL